jgi:hypothetical protein
VNCSRCHSRMEGLHSQYRLSSGVLGCRPASFRLEEVYGLQEQHSYHDVSMHEVRAPGIVRGKNLVVICAGRGNNHAYRRS